MKLPETFSKDKNLNVIIETPRHSRNKFAYDIKSGLFKLKRVLPEGFVFPYDFGFIPGTKGDDGDPLDVFLMMEGLTFPGCWVECTLIGVIKVLQKSEGKKEMRNDRFMAVPVLPKNAAQIKHINELSEHQLKSLILFIETNTFLENKIVKVLATGGPQEAHALIKN